MSGHLYRRVSSIPSTQDRRFLSFQPILSPPRTQTRILIFCQLTQKAFPIWNFFPIRVPKNVLELPFPQQSCQKMTIQTFVQWERLCLPYSTMILAICVVVDESKYLDILLQEQFVSIFHFDLKIRIY